MLDFRKQFQEIIEQSYIPFNIDKAATSDVWSNIYKLILPNIPEKLFRYLSSTYKCNFLGADNKQ